MSLFFLLVIGVFLGIEGIFINGLQIHRFVLSLFLLLSLLTFLVLRKDFVEDIAVICKLLFEFGRTTRTGSSLCLRLGLCLGLGFALP